MDVVFKTDHGVFNYRVVGVWMMNGCVLIHRSATEDHWSLPGGRVALREESAIALKREFGEELGVDVTVERLLWSTENFFEYKGMNFHELGFYYKVSTMDDSLFSMDEFHGNEGERLVYKWVPIEELNNIILRPDPIKEELQNLTEYPKHIVVK